MGWGMGGSVKQGQDMQPHIHMALAAFSSTLPLLSETSEFAHCPLFLKILSTFYFFIFPLPTFPSLLVATSPLSMSP